MLLYFKTTHYENELLWCLFLILIYQKTHFYFVQEFYLFFYNLLLYEVFNFKNLSLIWSFLTHKQCCHFITTIINCKLNNLFKNLISDICFWFTTLPASCTWRWNKMVDAWNTWLVYSSSLKGGDFDETSASSVTTQMSPIWTNSLKNQNFVVKKNVAWNLLSVEGKDIRCQEHEASVII